MKIPFCSLLCALPAFALAQSPTNFSAFYQNLTNGSQQFSGPSVTQFTNGALFGTGGTSGTTFQLNPNSNSTYSSGSNVYTYQFDRPLSGGRLRLIDAFQWGDWQITALGGNANLINLNLGLFWSNGTGQYPFVQGQDFSIAGSGSSSISLDQRPNTSGGAAGFDGTIFITGQYTGIQIIQKHDPSLPLSGVSDSQARLTLSEFTPIPEPAAPILLGAVALFWTQLRRRNPARR